MFNPMKYVWLFIMGFGFIFAVVAYDHLVKRSLAERITDELIKSGMTKQ